MALTPTEIDALPSYTAAQLLKVLERNIVEVLATGQSVGVTGKQWQRADLEQLKKMRDDLKAEIAEAAAGENGGGNVLVQFGQDQ